jgi:methyl-accepting chemotaxis protein
VLFRSRRIGRGGREIWLQASYNPILDPNGAVYKVVKYATDITQTVVARKENERGMAEAVQILRDVAGGMLTNKMAGDYAGTFADIKKALNATIDKLTEIVVNIKSSAEAVGGAANEISSGSADLSQRTEQQASNLEETAASMEEVTGAVKQNTENANNAKELAQQANSVAEQGGEVVERAVTAMGEIERSSQKIADIIGVIDEIAFQTNLLALNAAVEAARAGEAGKGFAVVAQEVRSLAGRSASASKEIKSLISESVDQVKSGAELVNQAGMTLKDIVTAVRKVTDIMSEIAAASVEQSSGIEEINNAITQMDQMTQQNAALVEENTAAAGSLVDLSGSLEQMISFFKVGEAAEAAAQAAQPKRMAVGESRPSASIARPATPASSRTVTSLKPRTSPSPAHLRKTNGSGAAAQPAASAARQDHDWKEF